MIKWIESKIDWYKALPWYYKVLAILPIFIMLVLFGILFFLREGSGETSRDKSDRIHSEMIDSILEEKAIKDDKIAAEIREKKEELVSISKGKEVLDKKAVEVREKVQKAESVDEIRDILKGIK